jgi:predicted acetyltransferase
MKNQIKTLWTEIFDDSKKFVDFYFDNFFSTQRNIFIEQNGKVISALQAIEFPMKIYDKTVPTRYLSGIFTDKNFRKQGFMRQIMQKTHRQLYKDEVWATTLIPSKKELFDIYKKFGYEAIFKIDFEKYFFTDNLQKVDYKIVNLQKNERKIAFEYFNKKCSERKISLLATEEYFETVCDLFDLEKKQILLAKSNKEIVGMAFTGENGEISELFFDNDNIKRKLLNKILQSFDLKEINLQIYAQNQDFGMLRIINAENFLIWFAQNNFDKEFSFNIFDNEIEENCGFYVLKNGNCTKYSFNNKAVITINELAKIVFYNTNPAMTYMMNV